MKRLAIIPARGGSKRIIKKNIKDFCGKPIISYSLKAARDSDLFDIIHVSTDCDDIADVVTSLGFNIDFKRTDKLSDDHTPIMPVINWTIEQYQAKNIFFDEVVLIMPCSPFIKSSDLKEASRLMDKSQRAKPVIAISDYPVPIEWAFKRDSKNGSLAPVYPGMFKQRSQDIEKKYFDTGSFIFFPIQHIRKSSKDGDDASFIGYPLEKMKSIDIDDPKDWEFAEMIMHALNLKENDNN